MAGRLHPEFGTGTVLRALGGYLFSEQGRPVRNQLVSAGVQRLVDGLVRGLDRLAQPRATEEPARPGPKRDALPAPQLEANPDEGSALEPEANPAEGSAPQPEPHPEREAVVGTGGPAGQPQGRSKIT